MKIITFKCERAIPFLLTCAFLFYGLEPILSQITIDDQFNTWSVYQGNHHLSDKWDLHTEYQFRRANGFAAWQQSLARIGLDYKLNPVVTISGGYGWIISYPYGSQPIVNQTNENRLWQQLILKQAVGKVQIQQRYRLEQRWIDTLFRQRIRYRAQMLLPLQKSYSVCGQDRWPAHGTQPHTLVFCGLQFRFHQVKK